MPIVSHNLSGRFFFTNQGFDSTIISKTKKQLTIFLKNQILDYTFLVTTVYAKCDESQRLNL